MLEVQSLIITLTATPPLAIFVPLSPGGPPCELLVLSRSFLPFSRSHNSQPPSKLPVRTHKLPCSCKDRSVPLLAVKRSPTSLSPAPPAASLAPTTKLAPLSSRPSPAARVGLISVCRQARGVNS